VGAHNWLHVDLPPGEPKHIITARFESTISLSVSFEAISRLVKCVPVAFYKHMTMRQGWFPEQHIRTYSALAKKPGKIGLQADMPSVSARQIRLGPV